MGLQEVLLCLLLKNLLVVSELPKYSVKKIRFCPLVTLDGNLSNFIDDQAYHHPSPLTVAECSLDCTSQQGGKCDAFTHNPLKSKCSIHFSVPSSLASVTKASIENPTTHVMFPRRLYREAHISSCLFPFTLNGTLYMDSCAVNYEYLNDRCNTAVCPALFHDDFDSQPHAEWVVCSPFGKKKRNSIENKNIPCLNSSIVISTTTLMPSKWILLQNRSSVTSNSFHRSWEDFKRGFDISEDYWIGNEALHLLTSMNCSQLFDELSVPAETTFVPSSISLPLSSLSSPLTPSLPFSQSLPSSSSPPPNHSSQDAFSTSPPSSNTNSSTPRQRIRYEIKISKYWRLRIELQSEGRWFSVEYNSVAIGTEHDRYSMSVDQFDYRCSDAGDGFNSSSALPFISTSSGKVRMEGWWIGGSGNLNSVKPSWPDADGNLFYPTKTRMFIQPVSKTFNVTIKEWI